MLTIHSSVNLGPRVQVVFKEPSRAKQSMRDECDINLIMAKFTKSGHVDHFAKHGGSYGFATSVDFHSAMNIVTRARQMFEALPASTRDRFNNEPTEFLDFVQDPENHEEMKELGLVEDPQGVRPVEGPVAAPVESARITPEEAVVPASEIPPTG